MTTIKIVKDAYGNVVTAFNAPDARGYFYSGNGGGGGGSGKPQTAGSGAVPGASKKPAEKEPEISEADLAAFLVDLAALTEKHGIKIGGCGCCGSPWVKKTEERKGKYTCEGVEELTWFGEKP